MLSLHLLHRARLLPLLSAALLAALAAGCAPPPRLDPLPDDAVILALGDSLTQGVGGKGVSYPQQLQEMIGRTVINAGISGETSAGARARAAALLDHHKPQLLILCTGGNDFLRRQSPKKTRENISAIVEMARKRGVPVVLIAVPRILPIPLNHSLYGDIASQYGLWMEDDILKTVLHDNRLKADQVHANAAGYREIASAVAALLRRAGAIAA